jgi:hypothetical protein
VLEVFYPQEYSTARSEIELHSALPARSEQLFAALFLELVRLKAEGVLDAASFSSPAKTALAQGLMSLVDDVAANSGDEGSGVVLFAKSLLGTVHSSFRAVDLVGGQYLPLWSSRDGELTASALENPSRYSVVGAFLGMLGVGIASLNWRTEVEGDMVALRSESGQSVLMSPAGSHEAVQRLVARLPDDRRVIILRPGFQPSRFRRSSGGGPLRERLERDEWDEVWLGDLLGDLGEEAELPQLLQEVLGLS